MYEAFRAKAAAVGAEVHRFSTKYEAVVFIQSVFRDEGVANVAGSYAVWAQSPAFADLAGQGLAGYPGLSFQVSRELAAQAKIGISQMDWAVADTGSLVQDQSAAEQRLVSSLPAIHIALVATGNILDGKVALFQRINPANSSYIAFITGPSRTADIERVLTIGVHGPGRLLVLCVDQLEGGIHE